MNDLSNDEIMRMRNKRTGIWNLKETILIPETHNKERRLQEFDTHQIYGRKGETGNG